MMRAYPLAIMLLIAIIITWLVYMVHLFSFEQSIITFIAIGLVILLTTERVP